jgi:hypothetical protein
LHFGSFYTVTLFRACRSLDSKVNVRKLEMFFDQTLQLNRILSVVPNWDFPSLIRAVHFPSGVCSMMNGER